MIGLGIALAALVLAVAGGIVAVATLRQASRSGRGGAS
jgi:hypothetical protein